MFDVVMRVVKPTAEDRQREAQMQHRAGDPQPKCHLGHRFEIGDREQQQGNRDGREEIDPDRMAHFQPDGLRITQGFQAVEHQQEHEQGARHPAQTLPDHQGHPQDGMGFQPGQRQSGRAHDGRKDRDGKMFEPLPGRLRGRRNNGWGWCRSGWVH
jgi:hypothetical protein